MYKKPIYLSNIFHIMHCCRSLHCPVYYYRSILQTSHRILNVVAFVSNTMIYSKYKTDPTCFAEHKMFFTFFLNSEKQDTWIDAEIDSFVHTYRNIEYIYLK